VEVTEQKKLQQSICSVTEMLFRNLVLTVSNSEALLRQFTQESCKQISDSGATHDPSPLTGLSEVLEGRSESEVNPKVGVVQLSPREREVVKLLANGHGNKGTAAILGLSVKTVEALRERIMLKLGVHTSTGLSH
jgi:DNA-binding CsgD family transcriptional regulator